MPHLPIPPSPRALGRADFYVCLGNRHVLLTPASARGLWFLRDSSFTDPADLFLRIGPARLLPFELAPAVLDLLAEHFRLLAVHPLPGPVRRALARQIPLLASRP